MNVLYLTIKRKYNRGMQLGYNYRLYPTPGQRQALARAFGCARVVFNDALRARQEAFAAGLPYLTDAELSARLTAVKATPPPRRVTPGTGPTRASGPWSIAWRPPNRRFRSAPARTERHGTVSRI
jgi:hypothetical protein